MNLGFVFTVYFYLGWIALTIQGLWLVWLWLRGRRLLDPHEYLVRSLKFIVAVQILEIVSYGVLLWILIQGHPHADVFLPPRSPFLLIHVAQTTTSLLAGWIASAILFAGLWYIFLRRGRGLMLDVRDVLLLVLCAAVVGWPEVLSFLAIVFVLALLWMVILILSKRKTIQDRLVVSPVIIPAAILTIIFKVQLLSLTHLDKIRF